MYINLSKINVLACLLVMAFSGSLMADNSVKVTAPEVTQSVSQFIGGVSQSNVQSLKTLIGDDGLWVCRIFTSGTYGGRGEDFCGQYPFESLNGKAGISVAVKGQTDILFGWLFPQAVAVLGEGKNIPIRKIALASIEVTSPQQTLRALVPALQGIAEVTSGEPVIILFADGRFALLEGQVIEDVLVGGVAFFELIERSEGLTAIYDLR